MALIPVIVGSTGSGKTRLAIQLGELLAKSGLQAEIINADSMQVYAHMDIGTAKPTKQEMEAMQHHLISFVHPSYEHYSVHKWAMSANELLLQLTKVNKVPIVVGGTHMYIKSLLDGFSWDLPERDEKYRNQLNQMNPEERWNQLLQIDPEFIDRVHSNDVMRVVRALETHKLTGRKMSDLAHQWKLKQRRNDTLLVGLFFEKHIINTLVDHRVDRMVEEGLIEEVKALYEDGTIGRNAAAAIGYKELLHHFKTGEGTLESVVEDIKLHTRQYAKRQRTWLRGLCWSNANSLIFYVSQCDPEKISVISTQVGVNAEIEEHDLTHLFRQSLNISSSVVPPKLPKSQSQSNLESPPLHDCIETVETLIQGATHVIQQLINHK